MTITKDVSVPVAGSADAGSAGTGSAEAGSVGTYSADAAWGEGLAYPEWMLKFLPALHDGFNTANKYVGVPALKMGLGRYISNPLTGYLMILRTRGRKSGQMRDAPLGYTIVGEHVYCVAGFGRAAHWFQNLQVNPRVEVILPGRAFSGVAEEVTDVDERCRVLAPLMRSMGVIAGMMGMGNPWRDRPEDIERKCQGMPLVRIRATGIAVGPEDPGGRYWVVPVVVGTYLTMRLLRHRSRPKA